MKKDFDRKQGIGGSDATRIYQGNWYDLYLEKIGEKEPDDLSKVLPVQMGVHTEDFNIRWFPIKIFFHIIFLSFHHLYNNH